MPISASNRYPRVFLSVLFGKGPQSPGTAPRTIAILGYKKIVGLGQGTIADGVIYGPILSADDAAIQWGYGSEMHQMADAALDQNTDIQLIGVSYPESGGGAYAEQTLTITGTATAGGSLLLYLQGNLSPVDVPIAVGDTPLMQATSIYNAMLKRKELPARTPTTPVAGAIIFRWNHKGLRGNLMAIRYVADGVVGSTYAITVTNVGATDTDPSTALDALEPIDCDFIVCPDDTGSASVGIPKFVSEVNDRADPITGKRGIVVAANTGTLSTATAVSTLVNAHRCTMAWCKRAEDTPARIAARYAVFIVTVTNLDISANQIRGGIEGTMLDHFRGPVADSDRITEAEATAALNVGLTPIRTYRNQPTVGVVTRPITTRFQTIDSNPDYGCLNLNCVLVPDDIADEIERTWPETFAGYKLAEDDPAEPNAEPLPDVLTPALNNQFLIRLLRIRKALAQIVNVEQAIARNQINSQIHPANGDRILVPNLPIQVIAWAAQLELTVKQVTRI